MTPLGIFSGRYLPVAIQVVIDDAPRKHIRYVVFVREQVDDYDLLILILLVCLEAAGEAYSIQVLVREGPTAHRIERVVAQCEIVCDQLCVRLFVLRTRVNYCVNTECAVTPRYRTSPRRRAKKKT